MDVYQQAVEQDRLFIQELIKTMTPEQINRFCFENGFEVPKPSKFTFPSKECADCCHWAVVDKDRCTYHLYNPAE